MEATKVNFSIKSGIPPADKTHFSKAKQFVFDYWFDKEKPSKSVTSILGWIENGKLTLTGKQAYRKLIKNL